MSEEKMKWLAAALGEQIEESVKLDTGTAIKLKELECYG
jgi:hypothetical protein